MRFCLCLGAVGLFFVCALPLAARPIVEPSSPIYFFTNIGARLLRSELDVDLNQIQVYPTNQYTPAVHRLLQFTANLYDATTNRNFGVTEPPTGFPSVFRPLFITTDTNGMRVYITGYEEVTNADLVATPPPYHDLSTTNDLSVNPRDMVYGIPLIIGARKGFPNFNEFEMVTGVQVTRKLEFLRYDPTSGQRYSDETNQMFLVGISNVFGIEAWNSSSNDYPRNLQLLAAGRVSAWLTNETGKVLVLNTASLGNPENSYAFSNFWPFVDYVPWPGFHGMSDPTSIASFKLPLYTNWWHLANSQFWQGSAPSEEQFILPGPSNLVFEKHPEARFRVPQWWLCTQARFVFALVDTAAMPNRIVDYVILRSDNQPLDITSALTRGGDYNFIYGPNGPYSQNGAAGAMWATNRFNLYGGPVTESTPTFGIINQLDASLGWMTSVDWSQTSGSPPAGTARNRAIDFFRYNLMKLSPLYGTPSGALYLTNRFFAPFIPTRSIIQYTSWQANDPLVHCLPSQLENRYLPRRWAFDNVLDYRTIANLKELNVRYEPWGGANQYASSSVTIYDPRFKDALVQKADDWAFPTNLLDDLSTLGQVHRGTSWQTVYLKSADGLDPSTWAGWVGTSSYSDGMATMPTSDWHLAPRILMLLTSRSPSELASVNAADHSSWRQLLDGVVVQTNTLSDTELLQLPPPEFDNVLMTSNSPQAEFLAGQVVALQAGLPDHAFHSPGDIFAVPELSLSSPWLHWTPDQMQHAISDQAYEAIPAQLLPRLRPDAIGILFQSNGTVAVRFAGWMDYPCALEISSDLKEWTPVATNTPPQDAFLLQEPVSAIPGRRFYRLVLLPQ